MIIEKRDFSMRQFFGWRDLSESKLDFVEKKFHNFDNQFVLNKLILSFYETLFFYAYRTESLIYDYYYGKSKMLPKLLCRLLGEKKCRIIYKFFTNVSFPGTTFKLDSIDEYDVIYLYVGAYSIDVHNICVRAKKLTIPVYFQSIGWDNLTTKVPLMAGINYLAACNTSLRHIKEFGFEHKVPTNTKVFPLPNHDVFKRNISGENIQQDKKCFKLLCYFPVKKYPVGLLVKFFDKFNSKKIIIDYKVHPSLSFDNGNIKGISRTVLEKGQNFELISIKNNQINLIKKYENPSALLEDYDVIISPAGSILLEAAIGNKVCIALSFGGLRFNYYGTFGVRAKHFEGLCREFNIFIAYDFTQLSYYLENLSELVSKSSRSKSKPEINFAYFEDEMKSIFR